MDAALEKLEKAVDGAPAGGDKMSGLAAELSDARTEITALEKKNAEVSERLGSAIGKVKAIIDKSVAAGADAPDIPAEDIPF